MRAAQDAAMDHAGDGEIGPERGAPDDLVDAVGSDRPGADELPGAIRYDLANGALA